MFKQNPEGIKQFQQLFNLREPLETVSVKRNSFNKSITINLK